MSLQQDFHNTHIFSFTKDTTHTANPLSFPLSTSYTQQAYNPFQAACPITALFSSAAHNIIINMTASSPLVAFNKKLLVGLSCLLLATMSNAFVPASFKHHQGEGLRLVSMCVSVSWVDEGLLRETLCVLCVR